MARTEGNIFVDGFRGKVGGNMVFRKRKSGNVIVVQESWDGRTGMLVDKGRFPHCASLVRDDGEWRSGRLKAGSLASFGMTGIGYQNHHPP